MTKDELKKRREEEEQAEQKEVESQLDVFFKKIQTLTFPTIPVDKIPLIEKAFDEFIAVLEDDTKDTDLEMANQKMEKAIQEVAPGVLAEKFDNDKHDSLIDFYESFIEQAKLASHKQTLIDLYNGWKAPGSSITPLTVLAEIENVVAQEDLMRIFDMLEGDEVDPHTDTSEDHEPKESGDGEEAERPARRREKRKSTNEEPSKPADDAAAAGGDSEVAKKD